jgi:hypothetical protein
MRITATLTMGAMLIWAAGCAGTADDLCTMAAAHVEDCTGVSAPAQQAAGTCSEEAANKVLATSCDNLLNGTRNTTFFGDLFDWLFGGGGGSKSSGSALPEPEGQPGQGDQPKPQNDKPPLSYSPFCQTLFGEVCRLVVAQPIGHQCKCGDTPGRIIP